MMRHRGCRKLWLGPPLPLILAISLVTGVRAAWSAHGTGSGGAASTSMPRGATPSAALSGATVVVRWSAASLPNGVTVMGYVIDRYDAATGVGQPVGTGCSGVITTTTCTEQNVPSGTWIYTDTPVLNNWSGMASSPSNAVTVP
jgi:hypothetical protein